MKTIEKERAERHARKEQNLRASFRGVSSARNELIKTIIHNHIVEKKSLSEFKDDIKLLLAYPENFIQCEASYNALFTLIENSEDSELKNLITDFQKSIKKLSLPKVGKKLSEV